MFSYRCKCKAVSDDFGFNYHKWDISTCHLCSCSDAAMTNCETACKALVDSYAKTGCGKLVKGTNIRYKFEAEGCRKGQSTEKYVCS